MATNGRRRRQLTVWWHVLTSVGWMAMSAVLLTLLAVAATTRGEAWAAATMAHRIDVVLLAPLANASAATGIVLGLGTPWGLTRHRWVLAKFLITLVQLYVGIFLLSGALDELAATARGGGVVTIPPAMLAGTALMVGALGTQAWLSVAKPGGPVRRRRPAAGARPPVAPSWVLVAVVASSAADVGLSLWLGHPSPFLSGAAVLVTVAMWWRERGGRHRPQPGIHAPEGIPAAT